MFQSTGRNGGVNCPDMLGGARYPRSPISTSPALKASRPTSVVPTSLRLNGSIAVGSAGIRPRLSLTPRADACATLPDPLSSLVFGDDHRWGRLCPRGRDGGHLRGRASPKSRRAHQNPCPRSHARLPRKGFVGWIAFRPTNPTEHHSTPTSSTSKFSVALLGIAGGWPETP
jgi:hypothetical protein